jgi:hypothetical protein
MRDFRWCKIGMPNTTNLDFDNMNFDPASTWRCRISRWCSDRMTAIELRRSPCGSLVGGTAASRGGVAANYRGNIRVEFYDDGSGRYLAGLWPSLAIHLGPKPLRRKTLNNNGQATKSKAFATSTLSISAEMRLRWRAVIEFWTGDAGGRSLWHPARQIQFLISNLLIILLNQFVFCLYMNSQRLSASFSRLLDWRSQTHTHTHPYERTHANLLLWASLKDWAGKS